MRLFFFTDNEPECCCHYHVFAEDEATARKLVVERIRAAFDEGEPDDRDRDDRDRAIANFLNPQKWSVSVIPIEPHTVV